MLTNKQMKNNAKSTIKKHYILLIAVCLLASFIGVEFSNSLSFISEYNDSNVKYLPSHVSTSIGILNHSASSAVIKALEGDTIGGKELSHEYIIKEKEKDCNPILGRSRGILAGLLNGIASGSIIVNLIAAIRSIGLSTNIIFPLFIILSFGIFFSFWFFFINIYKTILRRIFLESRTYYKIPIRRFIFFLRVKKSTNVSIVMFMTWLFQVLWNMTIIGGIIKRYSYYMVSYIVAENPAISWKDAIKLSRDMMNGHKFECFKLEFTFLPWYILGYATFGISNVFFTNPYITATFCEYYAGLRRLSKNNQLHNSELLNDTYLYAFADSDLLAATYNDVLTMKKTESVINNTSDFKSFMANVFGITLYRKEDEEKFWDLEEKRMIFDSMESILKNKSYPSRLFPIPEIEKDSKLAHLHYLRHYSIPSLVSMFFIFSIIGWIWEVSFHFISDGEFVNRGVLHGPWLPIYGVGALMMLILLNIYRKTPLIEFFAIILLCGFVEYLTSCYLEFTHNGQKWWDYSGYFLNLQGRISAEGLLMFGIGGLAIVYFIAPILDNMLAKIRLRYISIIFGILFVICLSDVIYSNFYPNIGHGITDYTSYNSTINTSLF